ncbi:lipid droplet-associated protein [Rhodococcus sp. NPDC058514]|uniref:lipid droplet-associated protein n=1 Tax=unclassified Rhodococcus (in: high G+C Gram-positive bacteria) TaxID=192944 RepID=UPI003647F7AE
MIRPPFAARVAAGIAVTVVEEVQKLPNTAVALPMTTISHMLQTTMRVQQSMTALAIKGDQAFSVFFHEDEEQPEWAVFDEDSTPAPSSGDGAEAKPANQGRFALYSMQPESEPDAPSATPATKTAAPKKAAAKKSAGKLSSVPAKPAAARPEIAEYLDYDNLTLAQLRARLRTLSVEELDALLEYENAAGARAPFQTMLGNRITSAKAK